MEMSLESNFALVEERSAKQERREDNPIEELFIARETTQQSRRFFQHVIDTQLTDCQRVAWTMVQRFEFDRDVVARLMGKKRADIDQAISNANARLITYRDSGDYDVDLAHWEMTVKQLVSMGHQLSQGKIATIERFLNPKTPRLTADELRPLGISVEEFERTFVTSLRLTQSNGAEGKPGEVALVVMWRGEYVAYNSFLIRASELLRRSKHPFLWSDFRGENFSNLGVRQPDEYLISIEIDDGNFRLTPSREVSVVPSFEMVDTLRWSMSEPGYHIVTHSARVNSPSLILDAICWRWDRRWSSFHELGSSSMRRTKGLR